MTNRTIAAGDLLRLVCLAAANPEADPDEVLAIVERTVGADAPADLDPEAPAGSMQIVEADGTPAKPAKPE